MRVPKISSFDEAALEAACIQTLDFFNRSNAYEIGKTQKPFDQGPTGITWRL